MISYYPIKKLYSSNGSCFNRTPLLPSSSFLFIIYFIILILSHIYLFLLHDLPPRTANDQILRIHETSLHQSHLVILPSILVPPSMLVPALPFLLLLIAHRAFQNTTSKLPRLQKKRGWDRARRCRFQGRTVEDVDDWITQQDQIYHTMGQTRWTELGRTWIKGPYTRGNRRSTTS